METTLQTGELVLFDVNYNSMQLVSGLLKPLFITFSVELYWLKCKEALIYVGVIKEN